MGQIKIDASNIADSLLQGFVVPKINSIVYPTGTATDPAGGTVTTVGANTVHRFTSSGSLVPV